MKVLLFLPLFLAGCATSAGTAFRDAGIAKAAEAYDESLANAEVWVCRAASVGSVVRRYGVSEEQWEAWMRLCQYDREDLVRPLSE